MTFPGSPAPPARRPNPGQPTAQEDNGEPMPAPPSRDPITALNKIHSEVVDLALTVQQTQHTVQQGHKLRDDFDRLFTSARTWAALLVDADNALGVSALARMPTPAARRPPRPWAGQASDHEVRHAVGEHLKRLAEHIPAAPSQQQDDLTSQVLDRLNTELHVHLDALQTV